MKNNSRTRLMIFALIAALFIAAAVPAYAAMTAKDITVYTGVGIYVDGKELHPADVKGNPVEAFIYEGTTYVPLRAVGEALGAEVSWDREEKTVYISSARIGIDPIYRVAKYDAGSGDITYTCGPMLLSGKYCETELDSFTIVDSKRDFSHPMVRVQNELYELYVLITGTVTRSERGYFLAYANCYDKDGALLRCEKLYQDFGVEDGVPFKIRYALDVPSETTMIIVTADRRDIITSEEG